jgi:hypothetical protein
MKGKKLKYKTKVVDIPKGRDALFEEHIPNWEMGDYFISRKWIINSSWLDDMRVKASRRKQYKIFISFIMKYNEMLKKYHPNEKPYGNTYILRV